MVVMHYSLRSSFILLLLFVSQKWNTLLNFVKCRPPFFTFFHKHMNGTFNIWSHSLTKFYVHFKFYLSYLIHNLTQLIMYDTITTLISLGTMHVGDSLRILTYMVLLILILMYTSKAYVTDTDRQRMVAYDCMLCEVSRNETFLIHFKWPFSQKF